MKPEELERIYPFMKAMTEGKRVDMKTPSGNYHEVKCEWVVAANYDGEFRIVEPPKPVELWVNVYAGGGLSIYQNVEDARGGSGTGTVRVAVRMVEAKEGE